MPVWSRDQKADWHSYRRSLDDGRLCQVRGSSTPRTYARRAGWKDTGLFLRSSQGSVENCFGSRVPHWTLLGMGTVTCPLLEDGGRTGDVAKESHQSGRERTQSGAARGTVKAASKQSRKERDVKQPGSRGAEEPLWRHRPHLQVSFCPEDFGVG